MTRNVFLLIAAALCFIIALLIATAAIHAGGAANLQAWTVGGLLALALSFLP